eukprot:4383065-Pleurochrysis_carterae.AAC.1
MAALLNVKRLRGKPTKKRRANTTAPINVKRPRASHANKRNANAIAPNSDGNQILVTNRLSAWLERHGEGWRNAQTANANTTIAKRPRKKSPNPKKSPIPKKSQNPNKAPKPKNKPNSTAGGKGKAVHRPKKEKKSTYPYIGVRVNPDGLCGIYAIAIAIGQRLAYNERYDYYGSEQDGAAFIQWIIDDATVPNPLKSQMRNLLQSKNWARYTSELVATFMNSKTIV